jgi:hypothetical protein
LKIKVIWTNGEARIGRVKCLKDRVIAFSIMAKTFQRLGGQGFTITNYLILKQEKNIGFQVAKRMEPTGFTRTHYQIYIDDDVREEY